MKIGFDNEKYLKTQSAHIQERIEQFGQKLYLEFGGKLFDDYHGARMRISSEASVLAQMITWLNHFFQKSWYSASAQFFGEPIRTKILW